MYVIYIYIQCSHTLKFNFVFRCCKNKSSNSGFSSEEIECWLKRYFQLSGDRNGG